jgi:hypothetical protein
LCPTTVVVEEAQSLSNNPSGSELSLVSQPSNSYLVGTAVMSMKYSAETTLLLGDDASLDYVVSHVVQPTIMPVQSSPDTTYVLRSEASFDHVINISNPIPYEQESVLLSPSMLLPSLREVSFD